MIDVNFRASREFSPGFQRNSIITDPVLRRCLLIYAGLSLINVPLTAYTPVSMARETIFISSTLIYLIPMAIDLAGGMPSFAWLWYAAFTAFFMSATIPPLFGAPPAALILLIPAAFCFLRVNRAAPHVLRTFGYTAPVKSLSVEIATAIIAPCVLTFYTWLLFSTGLVKGGPVHLEPWKYVFHIVTGALYYGTHWSILYGILMRRFLTLNFEPPVPIASNCVLIFTYWVPSVLGYTSPALALVGTAGASILSQITIGLSFYYCRSTRAVLFAYVVFYLVMKTAFAK